MDLYNPWNSPGQATAVGSLSLLSEDLPNPGIKSRSPTLKAHSLSAEPKGSPRILEWVAYPFSIRSSWPKNRTGVSCIWRQILSEDKPCSNLDPPLESAYPWEIFTNLTKNYFPDLGNEEIIYNQNVIILTIMFTKLLAQCLVQSRYWGYIIYTFKKAID